MVNPNINCSSHEHTHSHMLPYMLGECKTIQLRHPKRNERKSGLNAIRVEYVLVIELCDVLLTRFEQGILNIRKCEDSLKMMCHRVVFGVRRTMRPAVSVAIDSANARNMQSHSTFLWPPPRISLIAKQLCSIIQPICVCAYMKVRGRQPFWLLVRLFVCVCQGMFECPISRLSHESQWPQPKYSSHVASIHPAKFMMFEGRTTSDTNYIPTSPQDRNQQFSLLLERSTFCVVEYLISQICICCFCAYLTKILPQAQAFICPTHAATPRRKQAIVNILQLTSFFKCISIDGNLFWTIYKTIPLLHQLKNLVILLSAVKTLL